MADKKNIKKVLEIMNLIAEDGKDFKFTDWLDRDYVELKKGEKRWVNLNVMIVPFTKGLEGSDD